MSNEQIKALEQAFRDCYEMRSRNPMNTAADMRLAFDAGCAALATPTGAQPIDMVLHCPACGDQHIDAPELNTRADDTWWDNPPHKSHLCHGCGYIWRPADVPTNGVQAVQTKGGADSPLPTKP